MSVMSTILYNLHRPSIAVGSENVAVQWTDLFTVSVFAKHSNFNVGESSRR